LLRRLPAQGGGDWLYDWWSKNSEDIPTMGRAARAYLAIPAASVGVER